MRKPPSHPPKKPRPHRADEHFRVDFVQRVTSFDERTRLVTVSLEPDPRRYKRVTREGGTWFLDQRLNVEFRLEDLVGADLTDAPLFRSSRTISSALDYAENRKAAITTELETGIHVLPAETPRAQSALTADGDERSLAFLSVDVCGSTARRARDPGGFDQANRIMLQELGSAVGQFQGQLLKTTGDGFIAFIDGPGINVLADTAVDLGLSLLCMMKEAVNPALQDNGLEPLEIRIGADFGKAVMRESAIAATGFRSVDVVSDALNRAVKIEQSSRPNTFRIGYDLYSRVHIQWMERCRAVTFQNMSIGLPGYQVFEVQ